MPDDPVRVLTTACSVAIVGASDDPSRIGGRPVRYLKAAGYTGAIYPVNPTRPTVQGLTSYASVDALPEVPELAIIAVGRDQVPGVVEACGRAGIGHAIVFAAGYAETDAAGVAAQELLARTAREAGVRILGPNANGAIGAAGGATFAFTPVLADGLPAAGGLAIATQSAAVGTYWLRRIREGDLGLHSFVHTGNEADLGVDDVLDAMLADPTVRVVLCSIEQWRRPERLASITARLAEPDCPPLVVLTMGRTAVGRAAAASHTGGLVARRTDVVAGLLHQAGAHVVGGLEEALQVAATLSVAPAGPGRRLGILSPSGGLGILIADALGEVGFSVPEMPADLQAEWRTLVPFCGPRNPVDMTAQLVNDTALYDRFVGGLVTRGGVDVVAAFLPHATPDDGFAAALVGAAGVARERGVLLTAIGAMEPGDVAWLRSHGIAVFGDPDEAARILPLIRRPAEAPPGAPASAPPVRVTAPSRPVAGATVTDELSAKAALRAHLPNVVPDAVARTPDEAVAAARAAGYPVVLKLQAPGLAHKARAGGVAVGLASDAEVRQAATRMLALPAAGMAATLLVEPMVEGDELFVAISNDDEWGPLAILGLGGVDVEDGGAVVFRRPPVTELDVRAMVGRNRTLRAMLGSGRRERAIPLLAQTFGIIERLAAAEGVRAVELNPVIVTAGGDAVIVDALIEWTKPAGVTAVPAGA